MKKGNLELTEETANALVQLLNTANKANGLENAEACVYFLKAIKKAFEDKEEIKETI